MLQKLRSLRPFLLGSSLRSASQDMQKQYTRTVLFSTVSDILSQVVFRIKPSVRAAYRDQDDKVGASLISLYNKLNGGRNAHLGGVGAL